VWEQQYAEAHAKFEAHQKQISEARKADAEAGIAENADGAPSSYSSGAAEEESTGGALASDEALAALREKLSGGQS
jgi:small subunit ribosomal protein S1